MIYKIFHFLSGIGLLSGLCLAVLPLQAQEEPAASLRSVHFRLIAWDANIPEIIYKTGGKAVAMRLAAFSPSGQKDYTGPAHLDFFRRETDAGGSKLVAAGTALLPPESRWVLILLVPEEGGTYRAICMPDDARSFPAGDVRLYNGTPWPLAIKTDQTLLQLEPGEGRMVGARQNYFRVHVAFNRDGRWRKAGNNVFSAGADMRQSLFFVSGDSPLMRGSSYPVQIIALPERDVPADGAKPGK